MSGECLKWHNDERGDQVVMEIDQVGCDHLEPKTPFAFPTAIDVYKAEYEIHET